MLFIRCQKVKNLNIESRSPFSDLVITFQMYGYQSFVEPLYMYDIVPRAISADHPSGAVVDVVQSMICDEEI